MDPNETLAKMLTAARAIEAVNENPDGCAAEDIAYHAVDLAPLVLALDEHLRAGGALPAAWRKPVDAVGTSLDVTATKPDEPRASTLEGWSKVILGEQPVPTTGTEVEQKKR